MCPQHGYITAPEPRPSPEIAYFSGVNRMPKLRRHFRISLPTPEEPDHGPRERWQHSRRVFESTEQTGWLAARATEEHIIDVLVLMRRIGKRHSDAAFRLKLDYQRAGLEVRVSGRYSPVSSARDFFANIRERTDYEEAAYQRWRNALRALGAFFSDLVVSTVCHGVPPPSRAVKPLRDGLEKLADWYGMPEEGRANQPPKNSGKDIDDAAAR